MHEGNGAAWLTNRKQTQVKIQQEKGRGNDVRHGQRGTRRAEPLPDLPPLFAANKT